MFGKTRNIGAPGKAGKYQQPPGTSLYKFSMSRAFGWVLDVLGDDGDADIQTIIKLDDSTGLTYTPENCQVLIENYMGKNATTNWSSTPANFRLALDLFQTSMPNGAADQNEDLSLVESPSCDAGDVIVQSLGRSNLLYKAAQSTSFSPKLFFRVAFFDQPSVFTTCQRSNVMNGLILVPTDMILSVPGATAYPLNLTLIEKT